MDIKMTIMKHELRQGRTAFAVWTVSIAFLMMVCVFLFPEMKKEMGAVGNLFASLGSFTAAFGMDRLNFGTLIGFYAIECGNVLGLGGAFFAALTGAVMLSKEERDRTAEFLLSHPVSRVRVVTEKLAAVMLQIIAMNIVIFVLSLATIAGVGEEIPQKELLLMHSAYLLMQLELAAVCFGISAFLRRGGAGIGLGLAAVLYFLNLVANMTKNAEFLKYITPFGYCDAADIIGDGRLNPAMTAVGVLAAGVGIAAAYVRYCGKDIQ